MTEKLFCYCCRAHHPRAEMLPFQTRSGFRWRCRRSVEAAQRSVSERDRFGQQQSEINREAAQAITAQRHLASQKNQPQRFL